VPRGTLYRIVPHSPPLFLFHLENYRRARNSATSWRARCGCRPSASAM
jgi:hypothetical protein